SILEDPEIKKIGYDLKTLFNFSKSKGIEIKFPYFDIMVASYLVEPSRNDYSLQSLVWDYLSLAIKEPQPLVTLSLYLKLKNILEEKLKLASLEELFYSVEMPFVKVLAEMEEVGVKVDEPFLKEILKDVDLKLSSLREKIFSQVGKEFNLNSCQQLREVLFKDLGLEVIKRTKTGPSTDEEVLVQLANKHTIPKLLLEYRQLIKLKSNYLDGLLELINPITKRIHASFSQISTETGRISSSHPNLQNIPVKTEIGRLIRKAVVAAGPKEWLVSADYSQIELRVLAHLSQDESLIKAFKEDRDIHRSTASLLYGIEEDKITEQMRDFAKRINFGIIYGLSPYGLAQELNISIEEATTFIENYFLRYPKVKRFIQEQIEKAQSQGFVTTLLGRRRYLEHIRSNNPSMQNLAKRQAINTPIQGTAADLIKKAMIQIYDEFKKRDLKAKMILQIHDELLFEIDSSSLGESILLIKDKMENVLKFDVPIKVLIKKGKNWLEMEDVFKERR
ncbi:MAG: DNA polymerase I, partial [Candidatus Omnitrophica bacterium]|nr:DNA polymerase I [Candidatus Omnitrophota bacterium]